MTRKVTRSYSLSVVASLFAILIVLTAEASTPPLFVLPVNYHSLYPGDLAVADLNGDGKLDLVVTGCGSSCGWTDGVVTVRLGNGDGTFQPAANYDSGGLAPRSVAIADVNGDGKPDIVVGNLWISNPNNYNGTVGVLLGNGDGTFRPVVTYDSGGAYGRSVAVADLNGDGWPDLVVVNCAASGYLGGCQGNVEGVVGVLLGNGDGTFQHVVTYDSGGLLAFSIAIADVNGDGNLDLVVSNFGGTGDTSSVGVLLGNGNGTFLPAATYSPGGQASRVAVADVNGDGKPDIVAGGSLIGVLLGNGDGTFKSAVTYGTGGDFANSVAIVDVNGDGKLDLIVANTYTLPYEGKGSVGVLLGNGNGTFQVAMDYSVGSGTSNGAVAADLIGDGRPELLVTTSKNDVTVLLNNTAPYLSRTVVTSSGSPSFIGQPVTFTATIRTNPTIPDGELVTFYDGTTAIGKGATASGVATFSTSSLKVKTHTIKAIYPGNATSKPSIGTVKQVVVAYPTTTALSSSLNPSKYGQAVTFTATVTPTGPYALTAKVRFFDGTTGIGTATLSGGVAKLTKSTLAVGTHPITAQYLSDAFNAKSTSSVVNQVVQ